MTGTPLPHIASVVTKADDGYFEHTFRQSDVKSFDMCAERGRFAFFSDPETPRTESAAALLGTAAHAGIELSVNTYLAQEVWASAEVMMSAAFDAWHNVYDPAKAEHRWQWGKEKPHNIKPYLTRIFRQFIEDVAPTLDPIAAELNFDRLLLLEDDTRRIYLSGTIDLVDRNGIIDWKTASRAYQRWEHQRWAIQPTVYTYAASRLVPEIDPTVFRYVVFVKGKEVQELTLSRHAGDWDWMKRKLTALAVQVETADPAGPWLLNDTGWWCSPDWCSKWDTCKGASYPDGWTQ